MRIVRVTRVTGRNDPGMSPGTLRAAHALSFSGALGRCAIRAAEATHAADMRRLLPRAACPLQRLAIPLRQLRRGCVGFLEKSEQELVGVACLTHRVIGEDEL